MPGPKKAPRTKGNMKPSSSSQAAQLLEASGFTNSGFIGFSKEPVFVPASEIFDDAEAALDGDIRLVLRKLSKRDTVTKIKALQEFMSLCSSKDVELIKAVVPFWPRIYNKLAIDFDYKVRELSHKIMQAIAEKTGKCLAPHLKSLMGSWMICMCDTYPTVASAANKAFTSTFSIPKQIEALVFCKSEVVEYLNNNILKSTPQTLSDTQTLTEDEMETRYERVVSSSLQALKKLILLLPKDVVSSSLREHLTALLDSPKFWKHAKCNKILIKSATLSLMSAICQTCPDVSSKAVSKIAPFVVSNLDSTDPLLLTSLWEATLSLLNAHEDCWNYVNWQKAVWPKIKNILESGCCGQAGIVSPCLLPLLSKIPNSNYRQFFDSFRLGLCDTKSKMSLSDTNALVKSFTECIHYSIKCISDKGNDVATLEDLVLHQVVSVIKAALIEEQTGLFKTDLFVSLASLMDYVDNVSPKTALEFWSDLVAFIVENFELENHAGTQKDFDNISSTKVPFIFQSIVLLMQSFIFRETALKTKERVRFTQEESKKVSKKTNFGKTKHTLSSSMEHFISNVFVKAFTLAVGSQHSFQLYVPLLKELCSIHLPFQAVQIINKEFVVIDPAKYFTAHVEDNLQFEFSSDNVFTHFLNKNFVKTFLILSKDKVFISQAGEQFFENLILIILAITSYIDKEEGTKALLFILNNCHDVVLRCQFMEHLITLAEFIPSCQCLIESDELLKYIKHTSASSLGQDTADTHLKVWKLLSTMCESLDNVKDSTIIISFVDILMTCSVSMQKQLLLHNEQLPVDNQLFILSVIKKLLSLKEVWTHNLLGELTLNFILLIMSTENEDITDDMKNIWLLGLKLILERKADVEIQKHFISMSEIIKNELLTKTVFYSCLSKIKHITSTLVRLVAVGESDQTLSEIDMDLQALSNIIDNLVILDIGQIETYKEVCDHYYICNSLPYLPKNNSSSSVHLGSYAIISLYNAFLVKLNMNLQAERSEVTAVQWSSRQLLCLLELSHQLYLLQGTMQVNNQALNDYKSDIVEMSKDLVQCFTSLTKEQFSAIVSEMLIKKKDEWATYCYGFHYIFDSLDDKMKPQLEAELLILRTHFLTRLDIEDKIEFDTSSLCEQNLLEVFDLSFKVLLNTEDIQVASLADFFSGWISLFADYKVFQDSLKESVFQSILNTVKYLQTKNIHLLTGGDINVTDQNVQWNVQVARVLKAVMLPASPKYWEFTFCTLVEWIQFLVEIKVSQDSNTAIKSLLVAVNELSLLAIETFSSENSLITENSKFEWNEFFSEAVFSPLLQLYVLLCSDSSKELKNCWKPALESMTSVICLCPIWIMLQHRLPARLTVTDVSSLPDSLKTLLNHMCPLLVFPFRSVEVAAYLLLQKVVDEIPKHDNGEDTDDKQDEEIRSPPEALITILESTGHYLGFLKVIQIDDHIEMDRDTEEYAQTLGYLLSWKLMLQLFKLSTSQIRAKYAQYFKMNSLVNKLLDNLFRLMPRHPSSSILNFDSQVDIKAVVDDTELARLSLCVYRQCLEILPVLVRNWWIDQDRKAANFIDRFTTEYLSQGLIRQQILASQNSDQGIEDITIKARPAAREVLATYTMAEVTVNMTIALPENYPLGKLDITCDKRVGVSQARWDRWLLQLNIFLQHQNGTIVDGLKLWKGNIDKKFEGIDDCMICYSVIHGSTFQLPRLTCRTCHKKFHSACLYKWFNTSQKSSCPLCRTLF